MPRRWESAWQDLHDYHFSDPSWDGTANFCIKALTTNSPATTIEAFDGTCGPETFNLYQNYPNPFNPSTTIEFALPKASHVTLKIYDLLGNEVATLVSEKLPAGKHQRVWEAKGLASGVYVYRLEASDSSANSGQGFEETKKLILLR